jgi:hypothetical protein
MVKVTEAMVQRYIDKAGWNKVHPSARELAREYLEYALTEPPEPTPEPEEIVKAGSAAIFNLSDQRGGLDDVSCEEIALTAYRAMRKLEPLPEVTDEAVVAACKAYSNPTPLPMTQALKAAIPHLFKGTREKVVPIGPKFFDRTYTDLGDCYAVQNTRRSEDRRFAPFMAGFEYCANGGINRRIKQRRKA